MINRATPPRGIAPHCRSRLGPGEYYCPKSLKLLFLTSNRLGYCKIYLSSSKESTVEINQCYKGKKEFKEIFVWIPWIMVTMTRTIPYGLQLYYLATLIPMLDVNQTQHNANTNNFDCQLDSCDFLVHPSTNNTFDCRLDSFKFEEDPDCLLCCHTASLHNLHIQKMCTKNWFWNDHCILP